MFPKATLKSAHVSRWELLNVGLVSKSVWKALQKMTGWDVFGLPKVWVDVSFRQFHVSVWWIDTKQDMETEKTEHFSRRHGEEDNDERNWQLTEYFSQNGQICSKLLWPSLFRLAHSPKIFHSVVAAFEKQVAFSTRRQHGKLLQQLHIEVRGRNCVSTGGLGGQRSVLRSWIDCSSLEEEQDSIVSWKWILKRPLTCQGFKIISWWPPSHLLNT